MRITFVLPDAGLAGGVRVVAIHASGLQRRGHEVTVVSAQYRRPGRRRELVAAVRRGARRLRGRPEPSHLHGLPIEHRVIRHAPPITETDVPDGDVVIATWWETAEWVAGLSAAKGEKVYFIQHYEVHEGQPADRVRATWSLPMRKIAVAPWLARIAAEEFGDHDVRVVSNAVDLEQFNAPARDKQRVPTVGLMYSTKRYKGCDVCLRAYDLAAARLGGLRLRAFGADAVASDLPLPPGAEFMLKPAQDRLGAIYAGCDAWLFGSRTEGFGLPLLEAMACRTPVIATPAGAAPDLLGQGGGVLVRPDDPAAMAGAIEQLVRLPADAWKALSSRAREIAAQSTWEDATDRFEAALREAAAEGARREMRRSA